MYLFIVMNKTNITGCSLGISGGTVFEFSEETTFGFTEALSWQSNSL